MGAPRFRGPGIFGDFYVLDLVGLFRAVCQKFFVRRSFIYVGGLMMVELVHKK